MSLLFALEDLARHSTSCAVDPDAGDITTPLLGQHSPNAQVIAEGLTSEPALANERHMILDATLVAWVTNTRWVHEEPSSLSVLEKRRMNAWVRRIRSHDGGARVVEDHAFSHAAEESPGGVEPVAQRFGGLQEGRPHELIATHR